MAIQGNDWWYVGDAAIGGAILGALGASLRKSGEPEHKGLDLLASRTYQGKTTFEGEEVEYDVIMEIWADFDDGGFLTYSPRLKPGDSRSKRATSSLAT
jgi:hypothetical protein